MKIDNREIPKEILAKAIACETPEELVKLAKEAGLELSEEQAKAFMAELDEVDLDSEQMRKVAGGESWATCECHKTCETWFM